MAKAAEIVHGGGIPGAGSGLVVVLIRPRGLAISSAARGSVWCGRSNGILPMHSVHGRLVRAEEGFSFWHHVGE